MRMAVCILAILFAALHAAAGAAQWKGQPEARGRSLMMILGGAAVLAAAIARMAGVGLVCVAPLCGGMALICAAVLLNGRAAGKIDPAHHVIRIGAAVLLVIGFIIF